MSTLHNINDIIGLVGKTRGQLTHVSTKLKDAVDALENNHVSTANELLEEAKQDMSNISKTIAQGIRARSPNL